MRIFISYRHVEPDSRFLDRLTTHLASISDDVEIWTDVAINPGDEWNDEIAQAIEKSDVAVVLVSADSAASPFIRDVELPILVKAHRERRLRLVPLFVGPCGALPSGIAELQGANSPDRPLISMSRARQEATFADFAKWLRTTERVVPSDVSPDAPKQGGGAVSLERVPAVGLLFDRAEIRREVAQFLTGSRERICVVYGFPGVGKTVLTAEMVESHRAQFTDVFWLTCRPSERSGLVLLARIDSFLRRNGDQSLRGLIENLADADADVDVVETAVSIAVRALSDAPYLLVFDDFHSYLGRANELADDITRRLLGGLLRVPGDTKILVISDRRPALEQGADLYPTGSTLEQEILGLTVDAVEELIAECGLDAVDADLVQRIAKHFAGNPALIKVYCSFVTRRHRDPLEALTSVATLGAVSELIEKAIGALNVQNRQTLVGLAVLRIPLDWDHLGTFGLDSDEVVSLLDSSLVGLDASSHTVGVPPVIREFVLHHTDSQALCAAHRQAADGYQRSLGSRPARSFDELRPLLETGHHRMEIGEFDAGATAILDAVALLVQWGYTDLAGQEISVVEAHSQSPAILARCALQTGRIFDQHGRLDDARRSYDSAVELSGHAGDDQTLADALFRTGRIHNARNEFEAAEHTLSRCVTLCRTAGLGRPGARARLALAWARKEQGAPVNDVVAAFESALELAEAQDDHGTASDAHRQLGFIAWVRLHDRERCERNYEAAQLIANEHSLAKEVGAIHKELAYLTREWGDLEAAERHSRAAIEAAEAVGDRYLLPGAATNLALVLESRGDLDGAQEWLERSVRQFEEFGNTGGAAYASHELGRLLNKRGQRDTALTQLERARKLCLAGGLTLQLRSIEATIQTIRIINALENVTTDTEPTTNNTDGDDDAR